jgi:Cellulase (glycosyl hydrolase family 5)
MRIASAKLHLSTSNDALSRQILSRRPRAAARVLCAGVSVIALIGCSSSSTGQEASDLGSGGIGKSMESESIDSGATAKDSGQSVAVSTREGGEGGAGAEESAEAGPDAVATTPSGPPAGALYTKGTSIYQADGNGGGTQWIGRGVNMDDLFFCGYNGGLSMSDPGGSLQTVASGLIDTWKPNFIRLSLSMASDSTTVSWLTNPSQYATPMTSVIKSIVSNPNVYLLLTLRSDASMIGQDQVDGDPEATGLPSDSTTTPDKTKFPTGTDAVYTALVDAFGQSNQIVFGLTNEPGGNKLSNDTIAAAMNHAVGTIRAEEDRMGFQHHIVSVQGNGWTSDLSFYAATPAPITYDNVVYELHYYPGASGQTASAYDLSSQLPMIIGEYGSFTSQAPQSAFYSDMEAKKISTLAWDFEPFSPCAPDLLNVNDSASNLQASSWGSTVQQYLTSHAQ